MTRTRGTTAQRGYAAEHQRRRAAWAPLVDLGQVPCHAVTCLMPNRLIPAGARWDLGHTDDRTGWTGPEHMRCNRAAGARKKNALTRLRLSRTTTRRLDTSRNW